MCEEESDDAEAVAKLLEINDSIHRTVERYKLMKAGNIEAANNIPKGTLGTTTGVGKNAANELSLIDFEAETPAQPASTSSGGLLDNIGQPSAQQQQTTVEDDLLGLSLGGSTQPASGGISLGGAMLSNLYAQSSTKSPPSYITSQATTTQQQPLFTSSSSSIQSPKPNFDAFAGLSSALPSSKPSTPIPGQQKPRPTSQSLDPFASLVSSGSRPSTPSQQNGHRAPSATQQTSNLATASRSVPATDDEWTFASALPSEQPTLPTTATIQAHISSNLKIEFESRRGQQANTNSIMIIAYFSNNTQSPITQLHSQIAVEKAYTLQLRPQSGRDMGPGAQKGIRQEILLTNIPSGAGEKVKLRFKVGFTVGGQPTEEMGMVTGLGIA